MASLKQIRSRLKSITATQKITSAMKLVAAAKLKRAQSSVDGSKVYISEMKKTAKLIFPFYHDLDNAHIFLKMHGDLKFYIIFLSDRGLCGGFNSSILRLTRQTFAFNKKNKIPFKFCVIGKRGKDRLKIDFADYYSSMPEPSLKDDASIQIFCQALEHKITELGLGEIHFISSTFKNIIYEK